MLYYTLAPQKRFFQVDNQNIPIKDGELKVYTLDGHRHHLNEKALANYEVSHEQAKEYVLNVWKNQQQLATQKLKELSSFINFFESSSEEKKEIVEAVHSLLQNNLKAIQPFQKDLTERKMQQAAQKLQQLQGLHSPSTNRPIHHRTTHQARKIE